MQFTSPIRRILAVAAVSSLVAGGLALGPAAPAATAAPSSFHIEGGGFGHGVGMSQYGARGYADVGLGYADILKRYYTGVAVEPKPQPGSLRIWLGEDTTARVDATLTPSGPVNLVIGGQVVTSAASGETVRIEVVNGKFDVYVNDANRVSQRGGGSENLYVQFGSDPIRLDESGHRYRYGTLEFAVTDGANLRMVLQDINMQQYLYGLGEVPSSWPAEALRAQAVAARTYALEKVIRLGQNRPGCGCALYRTVSDQNYIGYEKEVGSSGDRWVAAVNDTNDQTITHSGNPIQAFYSSSSGGHTENSENIFVEALPYLRGVPDPHDSASGTNPLHTWKRDFSRASMEAWLNADSSTSVGTLDRIEFVPPFGVSGRVTRRFDDSRGGVRIVGSAGTKRVHGDTFRSVVNRGSGSATSLPSALMRLGGLAPYGGFEGGVFVAAGALDFGDVNWILTGADAGGGPHVRSFHPDGTPKASFFAYSTGFLGGVRVAVCNLYNDGAPEEIVTAPGPGGGPHVRLFSRDGNSISPGFMAYNPGFSGGVYVGCGDVDPANPGDEIITGAGAGGGPHVRVFDKDGRLLSEFLAYDSRFDGGVRVASAGNRIVTAPGAGGGPHVRVLGPTGVEVGGFFAYAPSFSGGVYVAGGDVLGDGTEEIVTGAGESGAAHVRVFSPGGAELLGLYAFETGNDRGARVAAGRIPGGALVAGSGGGRQALVRVLPL